MLMKLSPSVRASNEKWHNYQWTDSIPPIFAVVKFIEDLDPTNNNTNNSGFVYS